MDNQFELSSILRKSIIVALLISLLSSLGLCEQSENRLTYSRKINISMADSTLYYYAQNDPLWASSLYEPKGSQEYRDMSIGGCGPAVAAIAIANQLSPDDLPSILSYSLKPEVGYQFCSCSVNGYRHRGDHDLYSPKSAEDYQKYLPVVFASYATGNNARCLKFRKEGRATSIALFESLSDAYGLEYKAYREWDNAYAALQEGRSVITTVTKGIFTETSHYLVIAYANEEWIYIMDPSMRKSYPRDYYGLLEVVEPGLVRAKMSDFKKLGLHCYYTIYNPNKLR